MTRREFGLPEHGFVFAAFNAAYKITPAEWDVWMALLADLPGSVLWLADPGETARANMLREAAGRGVAAERLVWAGRILHDEHLARHRLADLFLDTFAYNAHTTAVDALWAGLPILTLAGRSLAARIAASLLHALGLPELVTTTREDYAALARALAGDPVRLADLRARLAEASRTRAQFDTRRYTRSLEQGLAAAIARSAAGLAPVDIVIPPAE
jgi:predicted O-linked N-acetylglucosamine transferase (SPINDLY family)